MNRETVQITLETEIPEIRQGDAVGVLCGLIIAVSVLVLGSMGAYAYVMPDPHPAGFVIVPLLVLGLSYAVGSQVQDSTTMVGADMAEAGADRYNRSWTNHGRDHGMEQMQLGMALMAIQFLFGAVYGTVAYLRDRGSVKDNNKADIASRIVHHLLEKGASTQEALFALPGVAGLDIQEQRETLGLLTQKGFLTVVEGKVRIADPKRYLFL